MNINYDETLQDDLDTEDDGLDTPEHYTALGKLDARRRIERHQEVLYLRQLLDDPSVDLE